MQTAAATAALFALRPPLNAQSGPQPRTTLRPDYDNLAKLASNENPFAPSESVVKAIHEAQRYTNRYRYPDPGLNPALAQLHSVGNENILAGAGSSEILHIAASAFLGSGKKVIGVEPTYSAVYEYATGLETNAIRLPLGKDFRQDTPALIKAINENARDLGLIYLCNPNNPTGLVIPASEIRHLLDQIPSEIPVLIDEAYHDFVEDPRYASSTPFVKSDRSVIIARTFSKLYGLAGLRLGYAVAPSRLIKQMRAHTSGMSVNVLAKFAGVAALNDTAAQQQVRRETLALRKKITAELETLGWQVLPSEANFFMVRIRRPVFDVIEQFRTRGVLVGRPFPPLLDFLRVSVGTADEMDRFMGAFKQIFA